jgi:hypothetical protein
VRSVSRCYKQSVSGAESVGEWVSELVDVDELVKGPLRYSRCELLLLEDGS